MCKVIRVKDSIDLSEPTYLCEGCLAYLKAQGYKMLIGKTINTEDFECEESKYCEDCGDRYDELTEVYY